MLTISKIFDNAFKKKEERNWEKIYVAVDIHETMVVPTWTIETSYNYYPYCVKALTSSAA